MDQIGVIRGRLESAGGLPDVLAASRDAFDVLAATCRRCQQEAPHELFAAFAFAAVASAEGWISVEAGLPPPGGDAVPAGADGVPAGLDEAADALAGLAQVLHGRLSAAAGQSSGPAAEACAQGAVHAAVVYQLLAREP